MKVMTIGAATVAALLASATPAAAQKTAAPAAATDTDAMCFMSASSFLAMLKSRPDGVPTEMREISDNLHRALGFYTARLTQRFPGARLAPVLSAASHAYFELPSDKTAGIASDCLDAINPELTKVVEALKTAL